jgi:hypothetical protein
MTDNEKRAHDLAISLWQRTYNLYRNKTGQDMDEYLAYKETYDKMLIKLNRDYPDQGNF